MRILVMVAVVLPGMVSVGEARPMSMSTAKVAVCLGVVLETGVLPNATMTAGKIFRGAGITIEWRGVKHCPLDGILVTFQSRTPVTQLPGSLAYALPYEGTHIVVFYDRLATAIEGKAQGALLGHVLAHEIGHILEGTSRHSENGVMKEAFTISDRVGMRYKPLTFSETDVRLIHLGIQCRARRLGLDQETRPGEIGRAVIAGN
jgi:hypothetical protein